MKQTNMNQCGQHMQGTNGGKDFKSIIFTQTYTESYRLHLPQLKQKRLNISQRDMKTFK